MMKNLLIFTICFVVLAGMAGLAAAEEWKEHHSRHFKIFYKNAPEGFVKNVESAAERLYEEIARDLGFTRYDGWTFKDQARIYIYENREDFMKSARGAGWAHGYADPQQKTIRTFPSAHGFFDSLLPHELGHIIFREFIGPYIRIPLWFEEGVAMYQEKGKRWGANLEVKAAIEEEKFIPLNELSMIYLRPSMDQELVDLFYAESASVVYYLISEFGDYKFVRLCRKLQEIKSFEQALSEAYPRFDSLKELNREWKIYVETR